jgi:hypothetical protein
LSWEHELDFSVILVEAKEGAIRKYSPTLLFGKQLPEVGRKQVVVSGEVPANQSSHEKSTDLRLKRPPEPDLRRVDDVCQKMAKRFALLIVIRIR